MNAYKVLVLFLSVV